MNGFDDTFEATRLAGGNGLCVGEVGSHRCGWDDEPRTELGNSLLGEVKVVRDYVGGRKGGDGDAEVEESVAVCGECCGIELAHALGEGRGWVGRVGPVIVRLGIKVVGAARTAGAGESGEGRGCLGQERRGRV